MHGVLTFAPLANLEFIISLEWVMSTFRVFSNAEVMICVNWQMYAHIKLIEFLFEGLL